MGWADQRRKLGVRTNADTPEDAAKRSRWAPKASGCAARSTCFRDARTATRHPGDDRGGLGRSAQDGARQAPAVPARRLCRHFPGDERAAGHIRLIDPPLHEFVPKTLPSEELSRTTGISPDDILRRRAVARANPMLGIAVVGCASRTRNPRHAGAGDHRGGHPVCALITPKARRSGCLTYRDCQRADRGPPLTLGGGLVLRPSLGDPTGSCSAWGDETGTGRENIQAQ